MTASEICKRFVSFFEQRGHAVVQSSSLIPDDPSVLLTTAGVQQFKSYYTGEADPIKTFGTKNTVSIQKSFRTSDIDDVGDESHLTFFEMLGNFSFGGYFKKEAIAYAYEFITKEMGLRISYVTVFEGSHGMPKDEESRAIWNALGVVDVREEGIEDVFWGPTGSSGPCGPTTEIYCKNTAGQDIEVWNIVFNEYLYPGSRDELILGSSDKKLQKLETPGVDTGMGIERLAMISQGKDNIFETDLFDFLMRELPEVLPLRTQRIIADHVRAIVFLISDGLRPSHKEAGYVLRRLMRRIISFAYLENMGIPPQKFFRLVVDKYKSFPDYQNLDFSIIEEIFNNEYKEFVPILREGDKKFEKEADKARAENTYIMPRVFVFNLHQSAGVTIDVLNDFAKKQGVTIDQKAFAEDVERHKEISRAGAEKKFGGHGLLLDTGELKAGNEEELKTVTRLHTATHLLQAALRKVLGEEVRQMGSDITAERTRFDFSFSRKLTVQELEAVERIVNDAIKSDFLVEAQKMSYEEAVKTGALSFFREKYPAEVNVYSVYDKKTEEVFSRELCGGPHVSHTGEIGHFRIIKEESSSAGVRRIRATVQ